MCFTMSFAVGETATLMLAPRTPVSRPEKCYIESSHGYVGGDYADGLVFCPDSGFGRVVCVGYGHRGACGSLEDGFQWQESQCVALRTDGQRFGVKSFKAYVDGRFVLFTSYRGVWTCRLKETPLRPEGKRRRLTVKVTDRCGNETVDEKEFIY